MEGATAIEKDLLGGFCGLGGAYCGIGFDGGKPDAAAAVDDDGGHGVGGLSAFGV